VTAGAAFAVDKDLVAFCGLYCGACKAYLGEKCAGCRESAKRSWCKVRACCLERGFASCADCGEFPDPARCGKFNNFMSKLFGLLFRSDRRACILRLREMGREAFAAEMAAAGLQSIKRGRAPRGTR
jgi:hypothetical protein